MRGSRSRTLDEIALDCGTDKASDQHNYTKLYEQFLGPIRYKSMALLELGVWEGASLRMWREYFPNAHIIGVDRYDRDIDIPDAPVFIAKQTDRRLLTQISVRYGGWDVIIDDASHISSRTIRSFEILYPHLLSGGLYIIEDLQTSYDPKHYGENEACLDPNGSQGLTAMSFCKRLADEVHSDLFPEKYRLGYDLESVQFYNNICFIVKA